MTTALAPDSAAVFDVLGDTPISSFADLGGRALPLALAAHERWQCRIVLVDIDRKGRFPAEESAWITEYRSTLGAAGVPPTKIDTVRSNADLRHFDLIANLAGFGDRFNVRGLAPILAACLDEGTRMITDIRRHSGAYPLLNAFGSCETLSQGMEDGLPVTRALFRANPQRTKAKPTWLATATSLAGNDGFFREGNGHSFLFVPRGKTLVVTFDNLDIALTKREDRLPWGFAFIEKQGWSMLGVMAEGWTWYRDPWVWDQFDRLAAEGFFLRFERVVFYGASMGGYAACAFSAACPGAEVVAISPQSTLDRSLVPWETRYSTAWTRDFSGRYGDAATASRKAACVTILYDPYEPLDSGHVARFKGQNVVRLRTPLLGHRLGSSLHQMGVLGPVILGALNGNLTEADFYRILRARRGFPRYQKELFRRALQRGRPELARRVGHWVLARGDSGFMRRALKSL